MIKKFIAPLQKIILQKKMCPACTRPLSKAKILDNKVYQDVVVCECGRIFVHEKELDSYRRAVSEDLEHIKK